MKPINLTLTILAGVAIGASLGILFAPNKGSETRKKIIDLMKKKGICCSGKNLENVINEVSEELE